MESASHSVFQQMERAALVFAVKLVFVVTRAKSQGALLMGTVKTNGAS